MTGQMNGRRCDVKCHGAAPGSPCDCICGGRYHGTGVIPPASFEEQLQRDRFWAKVDKTKGCWLWTGAMSSDGYGRFRLGRLRPAHRIAYEWLVGPIPEGLQIDHLCEQPACVRPDHLRPSTARENTLRSAIAPAAKRARQTHCHNGHLFDEANTYRSAKGWRSCKTCSRERRRKVAS